MDFDKELGRIAKQYEDEGYTVIVEPKADQVPPFAAGLRLDMIAIRGDEAVVVEVKPRRSNLADDPQSARIAEVVNSQPGWRFDLVILEPETSVQRVAEKAKEPSSEQFQALLQRARTAQSVGLRDMAIVYAWAALEAAMRRVRDDAELYGKTTPNELLRTLYSNGFISRPEFERARDAWAIRTQAVHGFVTPDVDPVLIEDVIALAKKIMGIEEIQAAPAAG
jgi:hypothetical protein